MPFNPLSDLPSMFTDFPVPVVAGGVATSGILDRGMKEQSFGQQEALVLARDPSILLNSGVIPGTVKVGTIITVDGQSYKVRNREAETDGALERLFLQGPL